MLPYRYMLVYTKERVQLLLKIDFIRFCIVGGTGFIINLIILVALRKFFDLPVFAAQFIGAEIALFSNFMLHHHWTYKAHHVEKSISKLIVQFHATSWPAILGSSIMVTVGEKVLRLSNLTALAVSASIALLWNFGWSKFVVWRDVKPNEIEEIIQ